jgi:anti-anti-sigma factor
MVLLEWEGEVTATTAPQVGETTLARLQPLSDGATAIIELAAVSFVDSTGIGMMLKLKKRLWQRRVKLLFRTPSEPVRNVLRMTKLESYLLDADP